MNNENKISIILPTERYQGAPELDTYADLYLESKQKEIIEYDRNYNLFLDEVFDVERQKSNFFNLSVNFQQYLKMFILVKQTMIISKIIYII